MKPSKAVSSHIKDRFIWPLVGCVVFFLRVLCPARGMDDAGIAAALHDNALSLTLVLYVLLVTLGAGSMLLSRMRCSTLRLVEEFGLALAAGLGVLSMGLQLLGWTGQLNRMGIWLLLFVLAGAAGPVLTRQITRLASAVQRLWQARQTPDLWLRTLAAAAVLVGLLSLFNSLVPPWDYDGLMYHLVGAETFLDAGRIVPSLDNWYVNGPFGVELLYTPGLALADDLFPKLMHWSFGALLAVLTFGLGRRLIGNRGGSVAVAVLLGIPVLPIWAGFAYIDFGWSLFELAGIYCILLWQEKNNDRTLLLAGFFAGLTMGSKYLGLQGAALMGLLVVSLSLRKGWKAIMRAAACFSAAAMLPAAGWYVKNLISFGNPFFPFYFGGAGWDSARLDLLSSYVADFGAGRSVLDLLLLPLRLYSQHERFGAALNTIDIPSVLFPLLWLYPFIKKERMVSLLLLTALGHGLLWAAGSQQLRFLLPVYPLLAVGTAYVIDALPRRRWGIPWRRFFEVLAVGLIALTLVYQGALVWQMQTQRFLFGEETRRTFLARVIPDSAVTLWAQEQLEPTAQVLLLGDGRGYYCLPQCLPDLGPFHWSMAIAQMDSFAAFQVWAADLGVTHLQLNFNYLDFLLQHDPRMVLSTAYRRVAAWQADGLLQVVRETDEASLLALPAVP